MSLTQADASRATRFHPLRIADIRRETPSAVSVAFEVPEALRAAFAFRPGQYLTLRAHLAGQELRRCYSICVPPGAGELRVAIKCVEGGAFSTFANTALAPGDMLDVMPPDGRFAFGAGTGDGRRHLAIAAGSGITPIAAILADLLGREPASEALLLFGSRTTPEIMLRDTLEDLKDRYLGRFAVVHVLSREEQELGAFTGRLDATRIAGFVRGWAEPAAIDAAYLCGPEGLITTAQATLRDLGIEHDRVFVERFLLDGETPHAARPVPAARDAAAIAHARVIHDGKTTEVPVAAEESVLDAALRAGLDLPWSCHAGMCCTCRAHLAEGTVRMRQNFSLEPWEMEAGFVLTCQSVPTSKHVTVDYDAV